MKFIQNNKKLVINFYFPDTLTGPNILFSLKLKDLSSSGDRILCILQVSLKLSPKADGILTFGHFKS